MQDVCIVNVLAIVYHIIKEIFSFAYIMCCLDWDASHTLVSSVAIWASISDKLVDGTDTIRVEIRSGQST